MIYTVGFDTKNPRFLTHYIQIEKSSMLFIEPFYGNKKVSNF